MSDFKLTMTEIYSGKDPQWAGWHNLCLDKGGEPHKAIAGPLDPETSQEIIKSLPENQGFVSVPVELIEEMKSEVQDMMANQKTEPCSSIRYECRLHVEGYFKALKKILECQE